MEHITLKYYAPKLRHKDRYLITHVSRYGESTNLAQEGTGILYINRYDTVDQAKLAIEWYVGTQRKFTKEDFVIVELNFNVDQFIVADASDPLPNGEED